MPFNNVRRIKNWIM